MTQNFPKPPPDAGVHPGATSELETRLAEARARLEAAEAALAARQLLLKSISQLVWMATSDGFPEYFNDRWFEYTGLPRVGNLLPNWKDALHPDDWRHLNETWGQAKASETSFETRYRLRRADGSYRWHLVRVEPQRLAGRKVLKWIGSATDIQEQIETEERLRDALKERDEFLSVASHELKTPLTAMNLMLQLLQRHAQREGSLASSEVLRHVVPAERQSQRLSRLIDDLLDLARIRHNGLSLQLEEVDLSELVRDTCERHRAQAAWVGSALEFRAPRGLPAKVDRLRIEQIVTNLISNAIKYGGGNAIDVEIDAAADRAFVRVRDRGIGIPSRDQARIFDRFERATQTQRAQSLGLGLFISQQLARAHQGEIRLESAPGQGSTFTVELPIEPHGSPST